MSPSGALPPRTHRVAGPQLAKATAGARGVAGLPKLRYGRLICVTKVTDQKRVWSEPRAMVLQPTLTGKTNGESS
jgi:hypothetical protein